MNQGTRQVVQYEALAICDAFAPSGVISSPGGLLVEKLGDPNAFPQVLAVGTPAEIRAHEAASVARIVHLPYAVIIPGLVNAHTHLDLTHIGPQPHDAAHGFVAWIDMIRARRHFEPRDIADSVRRGIELSRSAGVVAVGDIAGAAGGRPTLAPWRALRDSGLLGTSFIEFFAIGPTWERVRPVLDDVLRAGELELASDEERTPRLGLQPHAPNTVGLLAFRWAAEQAHRLNWPLATHLAETIEERRFISRAEGPQRELLERLGVWHDDILLDIGRGRHPVAHLAEVLSARPFAAAHVNDADDDSIETLAHARTSVVYCPRASEYFAAHTHFGPHRYRDMLAAGINVALGTDSIVNLPAESAAAPDRTDSHSTGRGMSIVDEMRLLHTRDSTDPALLLRMATVGGAKAIGLDPSLFAFRAGHEVAGAAVIELDPAARSSLQLGDTPLRAAMLSQAPSRLLFDRLEFGGRAGHKAAPTSL